MKQRMFNVFFRILRNQIVAKIVSSVLYAIIYLIYLVIRRVFLKKSTIRVDDARQKLERTNRKPNMDTVITNEEVLKELSIIIPAYNAEETIKECIYSVINQETNVDYEVIIVNDGSTDKTQKVIEGIINGRIRLINQENRGFSGARNRGIDECNGQYIMFLDSDDFLVGNCIEMMMEKIKIENADIVQGSYFSFFNVNDKQYHIQKEMVTCDRTQIISNPGFPWAKIYRRELWNNIRFPLDVWFEDTIICMLMYRLCKKIVVMNEVVYGYRINPKGITQKARHSKKCIDHYWVMEYVLKKSQELGLPCDKIQYELVSNHMSNLLYRRISLMDEEVIESAFIMACDMLDSIRPKGYKTDKNCITKDIEKAFRTRNYKLWRIASFIV